MSADVQEIRRILQVYDNSSIAPTRQAVGMLEGVTKAIAGDMEKYGCGDDDAWLSAGGGAHCSSALDFPALLAARWYDVLAADGFESAGFDKSELGALKAAFARWGAAFAEAELDFDGDDRVSELLDGLIDEAPDASSDDDSDEDDDDDSDDDDDDDDDDEEEDSSEEEEGRKKAVAGARAAAK
jgi:hypothetical protein